MANDTATNRPLVGAWNDHADDTHYLRDDDIREALCGRVVISGFGVWTTLEEDQGEPTCLDCRKAWADR